jgi:hypothetical protein
VPGCRQFLTLQTTADGFKEGLCAGIVYGVAARTIAVRFQSTGNIPESLCVAIPSAATNEQMVRVVIVTSTLTLSACANSSPSLRLKPSSKAGHVGGRHCRRRQNKTERLRPEPRRFLICSGARLNRNGAAGRCGGLRFPSVGDANGSILRASLRRPGVESRQTLSL